MCLIDSHSYYMQWDWKPGGDVRQVQGGQLQKWMCWNAGLQSQQRYCATVRTVCEGIQINKSSGERAGLHFMPIWETLLNILLEQRACEDCLIMHFGAMWHSEPHQIIQLDVDLWEAMLKVIIIIVIFSLLLSSSWVNFSQAL